MAVRYLVLHGELPGEGVWCSATTYDALVQRVHEAWGSSFDAVFKYKMATSVRGGEEAARYEGESSPFRYATSGATERSQSPATGHEAGAGLGSEGALTTRCTSARRGQCQVILNDEADFQLWFNGARALASAPVHTSFEPFHDVMYHAEDTHSSAAAGAPAHGGPLTMKLFAFRRTAVIPRGRAPGQLVGAPTSVGGSPVDVARVCPSVPYATVLASTAPGPAHSVMQATRTVTQTGGAHVGEQWMSTDNVTMSAHPYYYTIVDGVHVPRSSPAVKSARPESEDVVRPPMHSLLDPLAILKLGVRVVLRHSNATEVLLVAPSSVGGVHSAATTAASHGGVGEGCGLWGELVARARSAWGVHRPVFRYLDLSQGFTQITITNVLDYQIWAAGVGRVNPELLVLEQAARPTPPAEEEATRANGREDLVLASTLPPIGAPSAAAVVLTEQDCESVARYRAAQPPEELRIDAHLHSSTHLRTLVEKLAVLEREELQRAVGRPLSLPARCLAAGSSQPPPVSSPAEGEEGSCAPRLPASSADTPWGALVPSTLPGSGASGEASAELVHVTERMTTPLPPQSRIASGPYGGARSIPTGAGEPLMADAVAPYMERVDAIVKSIDAGHYGECFSVKGRLTSAAAPTDHRSLEAAVQAQQAAAAEHHRQLVTFLQFPHHRKYV